MEYREMSINDNSFAAACYNDNSIYELLNALLQLQPDEIDCNKWGITPTEWRASIIEALKKKINNYIDINSLGHGNEGGNKMIVIKITENSRGSYTVSVVGVGDFARYNQGVCDIHELIDEIFLKEGK